MSDRPSDKRVTSTQESLQPQRIGKEEKAYQSVLDIEERLQKGDATNIALTGPYGSGKSSVLMSLKEDYPEHNYLSISLATLQPIADELLKVKPEAKKGKEERYSSKHEVEIILINKPINKAINKRINK